VLGHVLGTLCSERGGGSSGGGAPSRDIVLRLMHLGCQEVFGLAVLL
jgi:hypothetical protein